MLDAIDVYGIVSVTLCSTATILWGYVTWQTRRRTRLFDYFWSEVARLRGPYTTQDEWMLFIERVLGLDELANDELDCQQPTGPEEAS